MFSFSFPSLVVAEISNRMKEVQRGVFVIRRGHIEMKEALGTRVIASAIVKILNVEDGTATETAAPKVMDGQRVKKK